MKCLIQGRKLYFIEYTSDEINWIDQKLTWDSHPISEVAIDPNTKEEVKVQIVPKEKLLFSSDTHPWTYYGLYEPLRKLAQFPMELQNPDVANYVRPEVPKDLLQGIDLAEFQVAAIQKAIMLKNGLTEIPTGGGKTEVILGVLKYLLDNSLIKQALIIVPSKGLAEQIQQRAILRGFNESQIGVVHGSRKEFDRPIVAAVVDSINDGIQQQRKKVMDLVLGADFVGYDETHHLRADSWIRVAETAINTNYLLGWSGSPFHNLDVLQNSGDALIYGLMGRLIFTETYEHLLELGFIARPVVLMKNVPGRFSNQGGFKSAYDRYIVNNQFRNQAIVDYARFFCEWGFPVLILVQRKEHALALLKMLHDLDPLCVFGGNKSFSVENGGLEESQIDYNTFRDNFSKGHYRIVIASQVMDEGMDIPNIGAVIMGGGGKSRIKISQRLGRGLRKKKKGYNLVYIVDFNDFSHVFLSSHSKKRKQFYADAGAWMFDNHYKYVNVVVTHAEQLREEESES